MEPIDDPDVQLMLAVQRGDRGAFERLFERHIAAVVGFAARFVGNRARAEELAQDVFLHLYRTRAHYVPRARFATWLYRMVTNACLSEVRRAEHHVQTRPLDGASASEADAPPLADPEVPSSEDEAVGLETLGRVRAALAALPPQQRAALLLARVEGFSYEEVAESLACSVAAVKSLVHRATVTLRQRLSQKEGQP